MRIKRIEIEGFRGYKDRTQIDSNSTVTVLDDSVPSTMTHVSPVEDNSFGFTQHLHPLAMNNLFLA